MTAGIMYANWPNLNIKNDSPVLRGTTMLHCSPPSNRPFSSSQDISPTPSSSTIKTRGALSAALISTTFTLTLTLTPPSKSAIAEFSELPNFGSVKALELRLGDGEVPAYDDQVAVHYYGRLAAKQGWRFDSTYDHKDENGEQIPFVFVIGTGKVISGIETAVKFMKVGGVRRVFIPPSQSFLTGRDCLQPFSIQFLLLMEKAQLWGLLCLILSSSA